MVNQHFSRTEPEEETMSWQWLSVCSEKACGWHMTSESKVSADAWRTRHERERVRHRVVVVALENTDAVRTPRRSWHAD